MNPSDPSSDPPMLDYSAERPFFKLFDHRRRMRLLIFLALALAGWLAIGLSRPIWQPFWAQAGLLITQYRISHQVLPPGTIIYTEDPALIAKVRSRPDYRNKRTLPRGFGAPDPTAFPDAWERAYVVNNMYAPGGDGIQTDDTFGYRRISQGGVVWIIHLDQVNTFAADGGHRRVYLTQGAVRPVGWRPVTRLDSRSYMGLSFLLKPSDVLTVFAPQPDPTDASLVHVPYELNGKPGVMDGVVTDKGSVRYTIRSGPGTLVK